MRRALTRARLNELKHRQIRVNVLSPDQIATPIQDAMFDEATKRQFESLIPRGKMGRPEEIATVAPFLASDDSTYVNGANSPSTVERRRSERLRTCAGPMSMLRLTRVNGAVTARNACTPAPWGWRG